MWLFVSMVCQSWIKIKKAELHLFSCKSIKKGEFCMLTNKKLLDEIIAQTNVSNNELREQLKRQILEGTSETSKSVLTDMSEKYEAGVTSIKQEFQLRSDNIKTDISELLEKNHIEHDKIIAEYDTALKELREDMENRIDSLAEEVESIGKALSDSIVNLQKDNSIIMESIQLILTNILINGVSNK